VLFLYPDRLKESLRKQKTAIRTDNGVGTVFMVAGAGFAQVPTIETWA
jgi:hypothetical protein